MKPATGPASPISLIDHAAVAVAAACLLLAQGCAGWTAWTDPGRAEKLAKRYGPTADQRIAEIREEAREQVDAPIDERLTFTQELIREMLDEHDPRVREAILEAAADFDTPAARAICEGAMEDPNLRVRLRACELCSSRGAEAVPLLAARLAKDTDIDVRLEAVRALGETGDEAAIPPLARALEDPDPAIQYRAVTSLKKVSGRDLGNDVNAWRAWAADPDARESAPSLAETMRMLF